MISIQQFHITNIYFIFTSSQQSSSHHLLFFQLSFLFFSLFQFSSSGSSRRLASHHLVLVIWFFLSSIFFFISRSVSLVIYLITLLTSLPILPLTLSHSYSPSNINLLCTMPKHLMISLGALDAAFWYYVSFCFSMFAQV